MNNKCTSNEQQMNTNNNVKQLITNNSADESTPAAAPNEPIKAEQIPYKEIIDYLNEKANKAFKHTATANKKLIKARWNEGYRLDDFTHVINTKTQQWLNTEMQKYLQPSTLFSNKFDKYLNERPKQQEQAYKPKVIHEDELEDWEKRLLQ